MYLLLHYLNELHSQLIVAVSVGKTKNLKSLVATAVHTNVNFDSMHTTPWRCMRPFFFIPTHMLGSPVLKQTPVEQVFPQGKL